MFASLALLMAACAPSSVASGVAGGGEGSRWTTVGPTDGQTYALLPTTGAENFEGGPHRWTASSAEGHLTVALDELPAEPLEREAIRERMEVRSTDAGSPVHPESRKLLENGLLSVPLPAWHQATVDPRASVDLEEASFRLGPLGEVTRSVSGSLQDGFLYDLDTASMRFGTDVCPTCDGDGIRFGFTAPVDDSYVSLYLLPSSARSLDVDRPHWVAEDHLVSALVVAVQFDAPDGRGTLHFTDEDGAPQRHEVEAYLE